MVNPIYAGVNNINGSGRRNIGLYDRGETAAPGQIDRITVSQNIDGGEENSTKEKLIHEVSKYDYYSSGPSREDIERIEQCIKDGVDINFKNKYGFTALMYADRPILVFVLIENGANPDIRDEQGKTALMRAIDHGLIDVAKSLISNGANVNIRDNNGRTALMYAVSSAGTGLALSTDFIGSLIKGGANVNLADNSGNTPLLIAMSPEISKILIDAGAKAKLAAAIYSKENINSQDERGQTVLMRVAASGNTAMVKVLISKGADVNLTDKEGNTALIRAVFNDHRKNLFSSSVGDNTEVVRVLVDSGADIGVKNNKGKTALDYTAEEKCVKMQSSDELISILSTQ
jgi:ankyrin repeat protein